MAGKQTERGFSPELEQSMHRIIQAFAAIWTFLKTGSATQAQTSRALASAQGIRRRINAGNYGALLLCIVSPFWLFAQSSAPPSNGVPQLVNRGEAVQLMVDGKPFLMLAGELHNSSSSSLAYMKPEWPLLAAMGLNTVLTPVSWELVEPTEGRYDFALVDGLLAQAREQHLHIVFLWLASWKNGMSGYPPVWVKEDLKRFPRAMQNGQLMNVLSTFTPSTAEADGRAFAALLAHLQEVDAHDHTVVMMQVENEVGILGASRDHSPIADREFAGPVPPELMRHLESHRKTLNKELLDLWEKNGAKSAGTWTEVFGDASDPTRADEIFMAWHYARYVQRVAAIGKSAYALPMYVNAWLGGDKDKPGNFPSGGPKARVIDIWKAAGSTIDLYSPDLYSSDFAGWCGLYHRPDNPLFIPETNSGSAGAATVIYAVGEHAALGFSPFGIDSGLRGAEGFPNAEAAAKGRTELTASYRLLGEVMPQILAAQASGDIHGFLLDPAHPSYTFVMKDIAVHVSLDEIFGYHAQSGYGLIIREGPDSFLGVGKGFRVSFTPSDASAPQLGLASVDEGTFVDGDWVAGRRLSGDENDQGAYWRFDQREAKIARAKIYHMK
jgi:hypothetical protein